MGSLPTRALVGLALAAVVLYAAVVWFVLVAPKRAEAAALQEDVIAAELDLADAQLASRRPAPVAGPRVSDVFRLAKAMPASVDQSGLILEIELLGRATGVRIGSITPREPVVATAGPTSVPVVVTAEGSYRQVSRFLRRARDLVRFRGGDIRATGRLLTVQAVELTESSAQGFPLLDATITFNSFVYDGPIAPATPPPSADSTEDDTSTEATAAGSTS